VLLQAGDLNTGVFDRFADLLPVCKRRNAWVHVDGAFGLWASASRRFAFLTEGIESADSWATDGHKLLNVPFDCGYAFVKDTKAHQAAMSTRAPYFTASLQARDEMDWNPEWSRRARGFATYAALRELGRSGVEQIVDDLCDLTMSLASQIAEIRTAELVWPPIFNQALVRFHNPRPGSTEQDDDDYTDAVVRRIVDDGEAYFGSTTWRGGRAMRISLVNWRTDEALIARAAKAVRRAAIAVSRAA
jgi:glutamate/tyrosine decarboxylase-like PLP-dependent enzyme